MSITAAYEELQDVNDASLAAEANGFEGIYEIKDAALYIKATMTTPTPYGITNRRLIRWIRKGLTLPALSSTPGPKLAISFEDLISLRVIALLRASGIGFPKIYEAESWLRKETGARRPFATEVVWTNSLEIFQLKGVDLIAASLGGQYAMRDLFESHLWPVSGLDFDDRKIAVAWNPASDIVLRPSIQFGEPCIVGTRIPTSAVWAMVKGGDSIEFLSESFGVEKTKLSHAIEWQERLEVVSAAA